METALLAETYRLINRVNNLITHIAYMLDNPLNCDEDELYSRLRQLETWSEIICANIESLNDVQLIKLLQEETPLYRLVKEPPFIWLPKDVEFAITQYCMNIASLREWANKTLSTPIPQQAKKLTNKPGRPRQIEKPFANYINTDVLEKKQQIIHEINTLIEVATLKKHKCWIIRAALELGLISKPSVNVINATFNTEIGESTYNNAFTEQPEQTLYKGYETKLSTLL